MKYVKFIPVGLKVLAYSLLGAGALANAMGKTELGNGLLAVASALGLGGEASNRGENQQSN